MHIYNNLKESKYPVIIELDNLFKKDIASDKRDELIVELYERNIDFVNNLDNAKTNLTISKFILLKIVYIRALDGKGEYKEGEPIANDLKILIDLLDKNYYDYNNLYINTSKWIAINLGRRKKYRASNRIFKELIKRNEHKEFYQNWISANIESILSYYNSAFLILLFLWAFRREFFNIDISIPWGFSVLMIILVVLSLSFAFFSEKIVKFFVERIYK